MDVRLRQTELGKEESTGHCCRLMEGRSTDEGNLWGQILEKYRVNSVRNC